MTILRKATKLNFQKEIREFPKSLINLFRKASQVFFRPKKLESLKSLENIRILLVEDNPTNQFIACSLLKKADCIPDVAGDGVIAIEKVKKNHYDIILMDIMMPRMDGYEATKVIREKLPKIKQKIPIIALTAYLSDEEREKYLEAGMNDCVSKPMELTILVQKISEILLNNGIEISPRKPKAEEGPVVAKTNLTTFYPR